MPPPPPIACVVLAAGKGTRMKSALHKVLHPLAGRPMLLHLLASVDALRPAAKVIVVGAGREQVEAAVVGTGAIVVVQEPQLGTAHAVLQAEAALAGFEGVVLVLYGDVPLIETATMARLVAALDDATGAVVLGFRPADAGAYGRIIAIDGVIRKMVEFKDADVAERAETLCNCGVMAVRSRDLWPLLGRVGDDNAAGEYYLPDIVGLSERPSRVIETSAAEVAGVNSRAELAAVEGVWQTQRRAEMMAAGVTLTAPETVWFAHDTSVAADVVIAQNVVFGAGVDIARGATIHAFSHIDGATIGEDVEVGPYARLRPGTVLEAGAKIGNFVEVKATRVGAGAKASHLSYLGDADIGAGANIGAGTITCNYDGYFKYRTHIGERAFIGSNTALVAPVTVGADAIVGAGSTVTSDVAPGALAMTRAPQTAKPDWATRFRQAMTTRKRNA